MLKTFIKEIELASLTHEFSNAEKSTLKNIINVIKHRKRVGEFVTNSPFPIVRQIWENTRLANTRHKQRKAGKENVIRLCK